MTSLWWHITGRGTVWTFHLIFSLLTILMVSTSPKVKGNKRMVYFFLTSVPFWIGESKQEEVIHNPWPICLLKASWAKVTSGKKDDRWFLGTKAWFTKWWKDSSSTFWETRLHSMCYKNYTQYWKFELLWVYVQKHVCKHLWRGQINFVKSLKMPF